jgi:hypothetical protein
VYGKKIFEKISKDKKGIDWKKFLIGTTFPDIRRLGGIDRKTLHWDIQEFDEMKRHTSFKAGIYAHSWVDQKRSAFLKNSTIFDLIPDNTLVEAVLKIVEDRLVYDKIDNWQEITDVYTEILPEETEIVSYEIVEKWHTLLRDYFCKKPDDGTVLLMVRRLQIPKNLEDDIFAWMKKIMSKSEILKILSEVYNIF